MRQSVISAVFLIGAIAFAAPTPVSQSVGRVSDHILTSREVLMNQYLEQALYGAEVKSSKNMKSLDAQSPEFHREVNSVLLEWMVYKEAVEFEIGGSSAAEVAKARARSDKVLQGWSPWKALEVSNEEYDDLLRRKLKSKEMIKFKINSSLVPVTDDEARDFYNKNRERFGDAPFAKVSESIKTHLSREIVDQRLKEWFSVLQSKYKVRNFKGI